MLHIFLPLSSPSLPLSFTFNFILYFFPPSFNSSLLATSLYSYPPYPILCFLSFILPPSSPLPFFTSFFLPLYPSVLVLISSFFSPLSSLVFLPFSSILQHVFPPSFPLPSHLSPSSPTNDLGNGWQILETIWDFDWEV